MELEPSKQRWKEGVLNKENDKKILFIAFPGFIKELHPFAGLSVGKNENQTVRLPREYIEQYDKEKKMVSFFVKRIWYKNRGQIIVIELLSGYTLITKIESFGEFEIR